jgi:hypothetical protein
MSFMKDSRDYVGPPKCIHFLAASQPAKPLIPAKEADGI